MKFSLVLATVGRTAELQRFLESLDAQTFRDFELIVIDQNPDERLAPLLTKYAKRFSIVHVRSEKGLSRARNVGLNHITGDVVAFPDDDCWYPAQLLGQVAGVLTQSAGLDGLTGRSVDDVGNTSQGNFPRDAQQVNSESVWRCGISYTIFLRRAVVDRVGCFDESLGVGAGTPWGAGEETDFLVRALKAGASVLYDPEVVVHHPAKTAAIDAGALARAFSYGCGWGRVLRKHQYGLRFCLKALIRPVGGAVLSLLRFDPRRAVYHWSTFRGRCFGLVSKPGRQ